VTTDSTDREDFVPAGLAALGIGADEAEMGLIGGLHHLFWPAIVDLLELDTAGVEPERCPDLSEAPR